jgi:type I restriction enzyme R subunit
MLVCIDKVTCARMLQRIEPPWRARAGQLRGLIPVQEAALGAATEETERERLAHGIEALRRQVQWMDETLIEIVIRETQNEVCDFLAWGFDTIPHRVDMKTGFETPDGNRMPVADGFKDPDHPFRIAIACAMWLTGFDVECMATRYIDKPMRAHNLMQAIARASRVYPGKECGVIVDYNGMLKGLRAALAQFAVGDDGDGDDGDPVAPIEDLVAALLQAIEETEGHLLGLGSMSCVSRAPRGLPASQLCGTRWTRCTRRMRSSGALRCWRGRCSAASRRC